MNIVIFGASLLFGFVLLIKGSEFFVDGAAGIAVRFGIPQMVIGLTIVAMGTSAPEAAVSITAGLKNNAGITIGNIVGSNILNILIILGITSLIVAVAVANSTIRYEIPFMLFITVLLMGMGYTGQKISFWEGIVLWIVFLFYLGYLFVMTKKKQEDQSQEYQKLPIWKLLLAVLVGLVAVVWGSDITVDAATALAKGFGLSERFIGLTIVALGTSLPELVTSVSAAIKGKADIAIGNIVGSNIFNILFVVGTTALIIPVVFEPKFLMDTFIAFGAGLVLLLCVAKRKKLVRMHGVIMLIGYIAYFIYLMM